MTKDKVSTIADGELTADYIGYASVNPGPNGRARDVQLRKEVPISSFANSLLDTR
jgi:hypothetical protein